MRLPEDLGDADADLLEPRPKRRVERVEEIVSGVFFMIMFLTLVVGVFWRYVLNDPLLWTVNLGTVAFIWTVMVSNGLPNWDDDHIQFDLLYQRMPPAVQRWARIVSNAIIVVTFGIAVPGAISYLRFVRGNKVTGLGLTFDYAFGGILVFFIGTALHRGRVLVKDIRSRPRADAASEFEHASAPPERPV